MAESRKRLDVYVRSDLRDYITEQSEHTNKPMNAITDELLEFAIAYKRGEVIEQQALPVITDIVHTALRRHRAELRADLREDMRAEIVEPIKETIRKSTDRVVALVLRTVRDASTIRRLVFTIIAKAYSPEFAKKAYEDARAKAGQELSHRSTSKEE
jgi:hypothetical protein